MSLAAFALVACSSSPKPKPIEPGGTEVADKTNTTGQKSWAGSDPAPAIPTGVTWFNVSRPVTLEELRGSVVLLDFWTLGCINCQHIIPDLKRLESEFGDKLVVIGVHSGKYATEHDDDSIRDAIKRYGLEHPVVNDPDFVIWRAFGASAWPTLVLIDPAGNLVGGHAGEGVYELFQPIVQSLVDEFTASGVLKPAAVPLSLDSSPATAVLSYPGKALADAASNRLYVADSGNNRIVVSTLSGELLKAVGTGKEGFADGEAGEAEFRQPQGLALSTDGKTLFVADTRNHAVRAVDTTTFVVKTIAGTGQQLKMLPGPDSEARKTALSSPWDVVEVNGTLFISMAGIHQLWAMNVAAGTISVFAGTSREGIDDGNRRSMATLAQPSGITTDGTNIYWVDPESSSVRTTAADGSGDVKTLVGTGLFDYGAADGRGTKAQLQHAQGVTYDDGALYISDTYNHRLRVYDITSQEVGTAAGSDRGWADGVAGKARLDEPGGLSAANGRLYIADTNNHLVRVFDPATGQLSTLTFTNLAAIANASPGQATRVDLPAATVSPGATNLRLVFSSPQDFHLNGAAPSKATLTSSNPAVLSIGESEITWNSDDSSVILPIPVALAEGSANLTISASVYYCRTGAEALCFIGQFELVVPITVASTSTAGEIAVSYELPPA
ncbi:MAG: thioredoxin-like domain-containing protein [Dehalococcoidia bacterium]